MKKLSDIPKKNIFEVPEGYFEKLPGVIASRVAEKESVPAWRFGTVVRLAVPFVVVVAAGIFWFTSGPASLSVEEQIAQLTPDQVQAYLDEHDQTYDTDISTEEVVESGTWTKEAVDGLEKSVYSGYGASKSEIEQALDELDTEL